MYTTPGVYLGQVPAPTPTIDALYGVPTIDPLQDAPALCIPYPQNAGLFWGDVAAGATLDQPLALTSCGTQSLTISSIETPSGAFSVPADKDQCPQSLPVGQSCTVVLRFAPSAKQSYSSTVTVVSNAPVTEAVLPLTGAGVIGCIGRPKRPCLRFCADWSDHGACESLFAEHGRRRRHV